MKSTLDTSLIAERLESLKAAIIGGLSLTACLTIGNLINGLILIKYFPQLSILTLTTFSRQFLLSAAITGFSGLLFGVTYRYIIRSDKNSQLKAGGIMAFGLVRGLAQVDVGLIATNCRDTACCVPTFLPFAILGAESIIYFAIAGFLVDLAIKLKWVKAFGS